MTASDARADLHFYLQSARDALLWKLEGLSEYDIRRPLTPTGTNLLGLVKHVAGVELGYLGDTFRRPSGEQLPWLEDGAEANADMWATVDESREHIVELYRRAWAHADATIDALALDTIGRVPWWPHGRDEVTLHHAVVRVIADTHRHAGHADIIRELVDGVVGMNKGNDNMPPGDSAWWRTIGAGWNVRLRRPTETGDFGLLNPLMYLRTRCHSLPPGRGVHRRRISPLMGDIHGQFVAGLQHAERKPGPNSEPDLRTPLEARAEPGVPERLVPGHVHPREGFSGLSAIGLTGCHRVIAGGRYVDLENGTPADRYRVAGAILVERVDIANVVAELARGPLDIEDHAVVAPALGRRDVPQRLRVGVQGRLDGTAPVGRTRRGRRGDLCGLRHGASRSRTHQPRTRQHTRNAHCPHTSHEPLPDVVALPVRRVRLAAAT